jgi:drug/metabolite transporter (DMT)-like permease
MSVGVFLMILGAALIHATWNAIVKSDGNRLALMGSMAATQLVFAACLLPFVAIPASESWPYLIASSIVSTGYWLFLNWAYQFGDLSHVYPFARGIAPLIVAVVSVGFLGEQLSPMGQIAVVLIGLGVASLALTRGTAGFRDPRPATLAVVTGSFTAGYTIIDAIGARSSGSAHGYMAWATLLTSILTAGCLYRLRRPREHSLGARSRRAGIAAGILSYITSWMIIWALTVAPIALVSALRETGIVFAVIIGVVFLRERLSLLRLASIATTLIGTTVLKLSR